MVAASWICSPGASRALEGVIVTVGSCPEGELDTDTRQEALASVPSICTVTIVLPAWSPFAIPFSDTVTMVGSWLFQSNF